MKAGILSAAPWSLGHIREKVPAKEKSLITSNHADTAGLDLKAFEREQLQGLVRQLFFPGTKPPVRHVVFSALEAETDVRSLCSQLAELVAAETAADVAFVDECETHESTSNSCWQTSPRQAFSRCRTLKASATQLGSNLFWLKSRALDERSFTKPLHLYLEDLRQEFEYSIVAAPPAAISKEPLAMAHLGDGLVLVLSAERTRRVTARRVKNDLGGVRLLGTVLCEREFPIPWGIYRRL